MDSFKESDKRIIDFLLSNAILTEEELHRILEHRIGEVLKRQEQRLHDAELHDNPHFITLNYEKRFAQRYGKSSKGLKYYRRYHRYLDN